MKVAFTRGIFLLTGMVAVGLVAASCGKGSNDSVRLQRLEDSVTAVSGATDRLKSVESKSDATASQVNSLQGALADLKSSNEDLTKQLDGLKSDTATQKKVDDASTKVDGLNTKFASLSAKVDGFSARIAALEQKLALLQTRFDDHLRKFHNGG